MASVPATSSDNGVASQQLVDAVHLAVSQLNQDAASGEPAAKRMKTDDSDIDMEQSIKQILFNINKAICLRLDSIENKLEIVNVRSKYLEEKVDQLFSQVKQNGSVVIPTTPTKGGPGGNRRSGAVIVGLPQERSQTSVIGDQLGGGMRGTVPPNKRSGRVITVEAEGIGDQSIGFTGSLQQPNKGHVIAIEAEGQPPDSGMDQTIQNLGPNVQLITLNTEDDFPSGCWLGDESNPEMRVRVPITPSDLLHVHSNCRTPEKMALTLLDYLFDRETQATSNLSGMGKHGKKQLDPLMIYGIRCHLIHRFGISEQDWHRIKQNVDSKCRTAFRRRVKGLPLTVKAFRGKAPPTYVHMTTGGHPGIHEITSDDSLHEDTELHIHQGEVEMSQCHAGITMPAGAEIIQSAGGEIQVLHATPEQVAQLQQTHQIQILQGDAAQVMLQQGDVQESIQVAVSMAQPDNIQVVSAESSGTIHIAPESADAQQENEAEPVIAEPDQ